MVLQTETSTGLRGGTSVSHKSSESHKGIAVSTDQPNDTHPSIDALLIEGYRRMSSSQKLERVRVMTRAVQELALLDVRRRHPDADAREQSLRVASRWLEPDLMVRAFGWDPRTMGF